MICAVLARRGVPLVSLQFMLPNQMPNREAPPRARFDDWPNLPAVPHAGSAGATAPPTAASTRRTTSPTTSPASRTAAVFSDAAHIVEEIALLKTRTSGATRAATAASPAE